MNHADAALLSEGGAGQALHTELTTRYNDGQRWILHYVTAREMYNLIRAAEAGWRGDVDGARDYELTWNAHLDSAANVSRS